MYDQGINKWLEENYGKTVDGKPLFRLIWSTGITEHRHSEFTDFLGDIIIRTVRETREVLKYPFAQNRWILERIKEVNSTARELGLQTDLQYSYEEVYIFQDSEGRALELNQNRVEEAMYLFFKYYLLMSHKERTDMRMEMLAKRDLEKRNKIREMIGEGAAPHSIVIERAAGISAEDRLRLQRLREELREGRGN